MSVIKQVYIICDDCGDQASDVCTTVRDARRDARGWTHRLPDGRDLCQTCFDNHNNNKETA